MNNNDSFNNQGGYNQPPVQGNMGYNMQPMYNQGMGMQQTGNGPVNMQGYNQPMMNNMGGNVPPYGMGSITFNRSNSIFGCALVFKVFIDGQEVGAIKRGKTVIFDVPYGNHQLMLKSGLAKVESMIQVGDNSKHFVFNCSVKMGFIQGGIKLELVNCHN